MTAFELTSAFSLVCEGLMYLGGAVLLLVCAGVVSRYRFPRDHE